LTTPSAKAADDIERNSENQLKSKTPPIFIILYPFQSVDLVEAWETNPPHASLHYTPGSNLTRLLRQSRKKLVVQGLEKRGRFS